jgi:hypothetical protein
MSVVSTVALKITDIKDNYLNVSLNFACAFVVEVIGAAVIVTSRIVGEKNQN